MYLWTGMMVPKRGNQSTTSVNKIQLHEHVMHTITDYSTNQAGNSYIIQPSVNDLSMSSLMQSKGGRILPKYDINLVSEFPTPMKRLCCWTTIMGTHFGKMESDVNLTKSSPTKLSMTLVREDSQVSTTRK